MQGQTVRIVSQAIQYIEHNLNDKLGLDIVAAALYYSKYHLHRYIDDKKALILKDEDMVIGAMGFSPDTGSIDFLAIPMALLKW